MNSIEIIDHVQKKMERYGFTVSSIFLIHHREPLNNHERVELTITYWIDTLYKIQKIRVTKHRDGTGLTESNLRKKFDSWILQFEITKTDT